MKAKLANLVRELGVPAHLAGYRYLQDAIEVVMEDPSIIQATTKKLYPMIAEKNNSTPSKIERAMRHAVQIGWYAGDKSLIKNIFKIVTEKPPCNSQYIATVAETLSKGTI